ncbi:MAG: ABC transporter permease, partial [Clostridiales bacterium]|nr:ABC transporter permease [Clostridiales bacterium]
VLYAYIKLKTPVLDLLKEKQEYKFKASKRETNRPFLQSLRTGTIRSKKVLVFFIIFSAFCFSAMTQMSMSMNELSSEQFSFMIITIGLILAFVTLILSLSSVIKANTKTVAMMRVFGYTDRECAHSVFSGYRPFAYLGFLIGTGYQYLLLKLIMTFIFDDISGIVEYHFGYIGFVISLIAFLIVYEMIFYVYSARLRKLSIKSIMSE